MVHLRPDALNYQYRFKELLQNDNTSMYHEGFPVPIACLRSVSRLKAVTVPQGTIYDLDVDPTNKYIITGGQV